MDERPAGEAPGRPDADAFPRRFGPWLLHRELGRGGMGIVYEATDERLDRRVALKVLRTDMARGTSSWERFRREAKACAKVRHENVVEVFGADEVDGRPCYAMTLLAGRTLADLARAGELPPREELFCGFASIADALAAIHAEGIVHRDVTPGNVMVEPDGRMVLADFGLARLAVDEALTQTGEALGTPYYMSPEQALGGRDVDGRTDLYGLGATLYELLAGRRPFVADDTGGLLQKILKEPPPPITGRVPDLPPDASRVVMKALEKRPVDRYPDAGAMRNDLRALAEGRPVTGRPVSPLVRGVRRHRGILAALLLVVAAGAGYALWAGSRPATLELLSRPAATVLVDGVEVGTTPLTLPVDPGAHEIVLRLPGFEDFRRRVELGAGDSRTIERVLTVENPRDPAAIELLAASLDLPDLPERAGAEPPRPKSERPLLGERDLSPVTIQDLRVLLTAPIPLPAGGDVEVESGGRVFARQGFKAKDAPMTEEELVARLAELPEDAEVRIRCSAPDGVSTEQLVRIVAEVPEPLRQMIAELEKRLEGQDPQVLCEMKARLFLAHGLPLAALREASSLDEQGLAGPHTARVMRLALERLREGADAAADGD